MLEFSTAVTATDASEKKGERAPDEVVKIDDREIVFHGPTAAQYALIVTGIQGKLTDAVASYINFFFFLIAKGEDRAWLKARLWDADDPFDEDHVVNIIRALLEKWSGKAIPSSSDSSPSPSANGDSSTGQPPAAASTPSAFGPIAS